jgi:hypothetical protein
MAMHADELPVAADLVRKLIDGQFPRFFGAADPALDLTGA